MCPLRKVEKWGENSPEEEVWKGNDWTDPSSPGGELRHNRRAGKEKVNDGFCRPSSCLIRQLHLLLCYTSLSAHSSGWSPPSSREVQYPPRTDIWRLSLPPCFSSGPAECHTAGRTGGSDDRWKRQAQGEGLQEERARFWFHSLSFPRERTSKGHEYDDTWFIFEFKEIQI